MTRVIYERDFPADLTLIVDPLLRRWYSMIPSWCQEFTVRYAAHQDARMAVIVNYRNRWAVLVVTGQWLDATPERREISLVHEIVHVCLDPLGQPAGRIIEDCTEEGSTLRALADSMFTDGLEAATEDLANCIVRTRNLIEAGRAA